MKRVVSIIFLILAIPALCACSNAIGTSKNKPVPAEAGEKPDSEDSDKQTVTKGEVNPENGDKQSITKGETNPENDYKQPEMKGEVSVNVYEPSEWLETAAQMFMTKYPDMKINIDVFYTGTDNLVTENGGTSSMTSRPAGQTREDYIAQLNNQLLSGKADDIVITSAGLPLGRYEKMGVFEDLSGYMKAAKEINESNYYMNVFDAYRTESGALYQLPISAMAIPLVTFDQEMMERTGIGPAEGTKAMTWREALGVGEKMYHASAQLNTFMPNARAIVADVFTKSAVASINYDSGRVELDREKMLDLLGVFKELEDYKTMPDGFDFYNEEYHEPYGVKYASDVENALWNIRKESLSLQWKYDDGNIYLSPYYSLDFGINGQSPKKELAWEFLKFLISDEVQTLPSCPNAGVNKKGLQARAEGYAATAGCSAKETEEMVALVDGWISQITAYRAEDTDLIQISENIFNEFVNGNLNAEETVERLNSRLEQYVSE